jgi:hypothetical protein
VSWDISIQKFTRVYASVSKIPEDERGLPLGPRIEIHKAVSAIFPGTDWCDPAWGIWDSKFGSIEFNVGKEDPVEGMMLPVRAGVEVVLPIVQLCINNQWQGLECGSGEFIDQINHPEEGLIKWSVYRDQVLRKSN